MDDRERNIIRNKDRYLISDKEYNLCIDENNLDYKNYNFGFNILNKEMEKDG